MGSGKRNTGSCWKGLGMMIWWWAAGSGGYGHAGNDPKSSPESSTGGNQSKEIWDEGGRARDHPSLTRENLLEVPGLGITHQQCSCWSTEQIPWMVINTTSWHFNYLPDFSDETTKVQIFRRDVGPCTHLIPVRLCDFTWNFNSLHSHSVVTQQSY